jgi:Protein of unknown function (DUF3443)
VRFSVLMALGLTTVSLACGGGSSHKSSMLPIAASSSNVQPIVVNSGPAGNYANGLFTDVTICVPSTSDCQTIDGILVDTGSFGLRILSSAGGGALNLSLPQQKASNGTVGECALFVSGYTWGSVNTADVIIAGEQASNVPVQVIDPTFAAVPSACKSAGVPETDSLQTLGANGILGVGPFASDCGGACAQTGSSNPGMYYECSGSSCQIAAEPVTQQVQNPVAVFPSDNNGVIIQLPALTGSAASLSGSMIFGIGTQANNSLGQAKVFPVNSSGEFTTTFKGQAYPAFIDSGSNALFFLNTNTTGMSTCGNSSGFYCPTSTQNLSAVTSSGSPSQTINFSIANADSLFSNRGDFVFENLGGPNPGTFDWGLPFFFGRSVFTAIEARSTPAGMGPFWAY